MREHANMLNDDQRRDQERRLSGLQGQHENLRDLISSIEAKSELDRGEELHLERLKTELANLETEMAHLSEQL
jgi:hypothetical protein